MRILKGLSGFIYSLLTIFTLLVYGLCYWTPTSHWLAGFMMMSLPILILLHIGFLLTFFLAGNRLWVLATLVLLIGWPFYPRIFKFDAARQMPQKDEGIRVVSFNILRFDEKKMFVQDASIYEQEFLNWIKDQNADILCFQEFAPFKGSRKNYTADWFKKAGYPYYAGNSTNSQKIDGPVIFSRYPLINKKYVDFEALNGVVSADVIMEDDTVSVFSVHLHSMTLKLGMLLEEDTFEGRKKEGKITLNKMKDGWNKRKVELLNLEKEIYDSKHPVILCGDFNETPFSYVYGRLSNLLTNAFEIKGSGFGFTFNQLPYFIRIDNQFYDDKKLELLDFRTDNNVRLSDHYPLIATYQLKD
jgi:endonuclease/exonuclease/phosphatase (EEP) superfamily protein YafD